MNSGAVPHQFWGRLQCLTSSKLDFLLKRASKSHPRNHCKRGCLDHSWLALWPSCHEPTIQNVVHLVNEYCGGQFGFFSSHASNSMSLAVFVAMMLPKTKTTIRYQLIAFVVLIGYSRVYLGAHYPGDVISGWIFGAFFGWITATLLKKKITPTENN